MNAIVVNGHSVTNAYYTSTIDPEVTCLEIGHNGGHYATFALVDTRFVHELQNFVWSGEINPVASINQENRQHLNRLNIRNRGRTLHLHKFIAMLATHGGTILNINHIGDSLDNRIKNLQWVTQADRDNLIDECDNFIDHRQG
jgi:hypothetical protein